MAAVEDFQLDGIPVFVATGIRFDDGRSGVIVYFRVGMHDEVFANAGISKLTARLVWASIPADLRDYVEVETDGLFSRFMISAPTTLFARTMQALAEAIENPSWEVLEQHKALLEAADELDGSPAEASLLHVRYGTAGAGTRVMRATAYRHANKSTVEQWIKRRYNRSNASIVSYEAPMDGVSFVLPSGDGHDLVINESLPLDLPAYFVGVQGGLVSFQVKALLDMTSFICFAMLAKLLERRLVKMESLTSEVSFQQRIIDSDACVMTGAFLAPETNVVDAVIAVRQTIADAANGLLSEELLESEVATVAAALTDSNPAEEANYLARCRLLPGLATPDRQRQQLALVDMHEVTAIMRRLNESLLVQSPIELDVERTGLSSLPEVTYTPVAGEGMHLVRPTRIFNWQKSLRYDQHAISISDKRSTVTVPFADCTAAFDNGLTLTLIARTGDALGFDPVTWPNGNEVMSLIRDRVPKASIVRVEPTDEDLKLRTDTEGYLKNFKGWRLYVVLPLLLFAIFNVIRLAGHLVDPDAASDVRAMAAIGLLLMAGVGLWSYRRR